MGLQQGNHTYYTLQHKPYINTDTEDSIKDQEWKFSSFDFFGHVAEPNPKRKSHEELHEVWCVTGEKGWWTLEYALNALNRLIIANAKGKIGNTEIKYEFRIVKVEISYKYEPING